MGFVSVQGCGPTTSPCSEANCGGCCDATGRCASGSTPDLCGSAGARCAKCPTGAQCLQQVCTIIQGAGGGTTAGGSAAGGTAGGTAGGATAGGAATAGGNATAGGSATGGGTAGGMVNPGSCRVVNTFTAPMASGNYRANATTQVWFSEFVAPASVGSPLFIKGEAQLYRPLGMTPTFPLNGTISPQTLAKTCNECFILSTACDANGMNCAGTLLGRSGTYSFTGATMNSFSGNAQNVAFQHWDLQTDMPVNTAEPCIFIQSITFSSTF
ncbi:MAG: hypothetical protein Q8N26_01570 [Myxococcales bacterium]|nr:hypothetical protein [Myxococcales bacterium]